MPLLPRLLRGLLALAVLAVALPSRAEMVDASYQFTFKGRQRHYDVSRPTSCVADCPVMLDLHGFLGSARSQRKESGQYQKGDQNGYIVVYADGVQSSWNAGRGVYGACCGTALKKDIDDVGFLREVIARVAAAYPVDRSRVYVTGYSNGCAMAQRLAVEASDVFAAEACTSLYLLTPQTALARPITVTEFHAFKDATIPYDGSAKWTSAQANFARWAVLNGCTGQPVRTALTADSYVDVYTTCAGGNTVTLYSLAHSGHDTYQNTDGIDVAQRVWDAVKDRRLR